MGNVGALVSGVFGSSCSVVVSLAEGKKGAWRMKSRSCMKIDQKVAHFQGKNVISFGV
jgi:hypothetical protein